MPYLIATKAESQIWIHKILLLFKIFFILRVLLKEKKADFIIVYGLLQSSVG